MNRPHLFFSNPLEERDRFRQPQRYFETEEKEEDTKDYRPMRDVFQTCRENFFTDRKTRIKKRNIELNIPEHLEYIEIHFFDAFNSYKFENVYRTRFGLAPVYFKNFNGTGIFAILEPRLFNGFLHQLKVFIDTDSYLDIPTFDKHILFIKEFYFLSTERIIEYPELKSYVILNLVKNPELYQSFTQPIENSLIGYLEEKGILYHKREEEEQIELINVESDILTEIADNFDIIHSVNSYASGIVRPSLFNTPIKEYGFNISNRDEDLPVIGVIDTGISRDTPLAPIIINVANEYNLTNSPTTFDEANHGSAVGLFAALGNRLIPDHVGQFEADARLLPIKIMNTANGTVKISEVERLIRKAYVEYGCKIFTLTILFDQPLKSNAVISEYAYMLDRLAFELDILVFISTGNCKSDSLIEDILSLQLVNYPNHYNDESRNICSPADSRNNLVIGAIADNFEDNGADVFATDSHFPASCSRKFNFEFNGIIKKQNRISKHLSKPDIAMQGGDVDQEISSEFTGIKVLSTRTGFFFDRECGTSYSAPLAANLAAKILRVYPNLRENMQSVKALIINAAIKPDFGNVFKHVKINSEKLTGKGIPNIEHVLYSNDNSITLLLEDTISTDQIHIYPVRIPEYLQTLNHKLSVLNITATICYKFKPVPESHISYCPVLISFGIFGNKDINNQKSADYKLKGGQSWSEDYYFGTKLFSNCQKISLNLKKETLVKEEFILKLSVNCQLHKMLSANQKIDLNMDYPFSLVINFNEIPSKGVLSGNLYNETEAINRLENIADLEASLDI